MKIKERLYEFEHKRGETLYTVRLWIQDNGQEIPSPSFYKGVMMGAYSNHEGDIAEALASQENVNAVQVGFVHGESIIIYPNWP